MAGRRKIEFKLWGEATQTKRQAALRAATWRWPEVEKSKNNCKSES